MIKGDTTLTSTAMARQAETVRTPVINKVPEVTLSFWIIKILSTTVGETAADFLAVNVGWGQTTTRVVMATALATALAAQLRTTRYTPWIYWLTVVLVSVVGTQITDLLTDGLEISLYVSTAAFALLLALVFYGWHLMEGTLSIHHIVTRRREWFYWLAILCTFALGTAAGDLTTEALGVGFTWGSLTFGALIGVSYFLWRVGFDAVATFWIAYVLSRPLGASLGDLLTQGKVYGGLGLGALRTSALFFAAIVALVAWAHTRQTRSRREA